MNFTVSIPLKTYLIDYYSHKYGNPALGSKDNILGLSIEPFLQKSPARPEREPKDENVLIVKLTYVRGDRYKDMRVYNYISPKDKVALAKLLEKLFWQIFFHYMEMHTNIHEAMDEFLMSNNIDYCHIDSFKQRWFRERKRKKELTV
jgi:hypothetical protein